MNTLRETNSKMREPSSKLVAFIGVMTALEFVVLLLETYVFGVIIPLAPPCILSLSVAITLSVFGNYRYMFVGGTALGVCSFILAFIIGNPVFIFPWISILPRVFIGIVAFGVTKLCISIFSKSKSKFCKENLPYSIGAVFGVITNTVLVLFLLYVFKFVGMEDIVATFMAINFPLEVVGSAILVPILVKTVKSSLRIK